MLNNALTNSNFINYLLNTIREFRIKKRLSQSYIAFELGITQTYYSRIERGKKDMTLLQFRKISQLLELDVAKVLSDCKKNDWDFEYTIQDELKYLKGNVDFLLEELHHLRAQNVYLTQILRSQKLLKA